MGALWATVLVIVVLTGINAPKWLIVVAAIAGAIWATPLILRKARDLELERASARDSLDRIAEGVGGVAMPAEGSLVEAIGKLDEGVRERLIQLRGSLRDAEQMLRGAEEALIATDASGRMVTCNAAAEWLLGRGLASLRGRAIDQVFTQADLVSLHAAGLRGERRHERVKMARPAGVRIFEASVAPLDVEGDDESGGVLMSLRDVTEEAQAVQVKADFVANASHELRTPIAAIRMAVETLAAQAKDDPAMRDRLIDMIGEHTNRLEELIRDLLDLSRLENPEFRVSASSFAASDLAVGLYDTFAEACKARRLELAFEFDDELERMQTDRGLVTLILKNLIENSAKFAHEGTTIRVVGRAKGRDARFEVSDRGLGIPLALQSRIFERFYQVDESRTVAPQRTGTGLGLAIVKHAVRTLGGQVRVESIWKQGTTMIVELPGCLE